MLADWEIEKGLSRKIRWSSPFELFDSSGERKVLGVDSKVTDVVNNASGEFTPFFVLEGEGVVWNES